MKNYDLIIKELRAIREDIAECNNNLELSELRRKEDYLNIQKLAHELPKQWENAPFVVRDYVQDKIHVHTYKGV